MGELIHLHIFAENILSGPVAVYMSRLLALPKGMLIFHLPWPLSMQTLMEDLQSSFVQQNNENSSILSCVGISDHCLEY